MKHVNSWEGLPMALSVQEVALVLGVSRARVYKMMKDDSLPKVQIGRTHKVYREALRHWLQQSIPA